MKQEDIESVEMIRTHDGYFVFKRIFDVIASIILLILCSPLLIIIFFLLLIDDGFPVIFRQTRIGKDGYPFVIRKFRTMPHVKKTDVKGTGDYENWKNGVPNDFVFKSNSPPESTKLGKLLRKYSIDELPQLLNVLKGDMSLIGPRPEVPAITRYYNQEQQQRLLMKPGITGYAQVKGRSRLTHGEKIIYDRYYVGNVSLRLDCIILIKTVKHIIHPEDSY